MTTVERAGEGVARLLSRRRFLNRTAGLVFGATATAAVGAIRAPSAFADHGSNCPNNGSTWFSCNCSALGGVYCNQINPSYCNGAACAGGCTYNGIIWPNDYCWCTKLCEYNCGTCAAYIGYWQCCDCTCPGNQACTCRTFVKTCQTLVSPSRKGRECIPCC